MAADAPEFRITLLLPGEPGSYWCWCGTCGPSKLGVFLGAIGQGSAENVHCRLPWAKCRVLPDAN